MPSIHYQPVIHKERSCILITFPPDAALNSRMKNVPGCRWSRTLKGWTIPDTEENRKRCHIEALSSLSASHSLIVAKPQQSATPLPGKVIQMGPAATAGTTECHFLSEANRQALQQFLQHLSLKGYSPSTCKTYRTELISFLQVLGTTPATELSTSRIKDYLQYCHQTCKLSENTIHSRINALKFYYEQVLGREQFFWQIPRPKKPYQLPKVLGEDELRRLFKALAFTKHKAILFTAYSAGLRVSEVVQLQLKHIDRSRMQLLIERSKGKKDRLVGLSPVLLDILEGYYKKAEPKPIKYLFEGQQSGTMYGVRTAQKVFQIAKEKAGIRKEIGFHSLRHSFATHLLEKGVDIRYIKDLLGHFDIRTTERYLHVRKDKLVNIVSPLDDLWKSEETEW